MKQTLSTLFALLLMLSLGSAYAEEVKCSAASGDCVLSENSMSCNCANGVSVGGGVTEPDPGDGDVPDNSYTVDEETCQAILLEYCGGWAVVDECDSQKGACIIYENDRVSCECADGNMTDSGSTDGGTSDGYNPDADGDAAEPTEPDQGGAEDMPAAAPLDEAVACADLLETTCPNDPPDPAESCSEDELTVCTGLSTWYAGCYEATVWPYMIIDCCEQAAEDMDSMEAMWECLDGKVCGEADECFPEDSAEGSVAADLFGGGATGESNWETDAPSVEDDDEEDGGQLVDKGIGDGTDGSDGCQQGPTSLGWLALMLLAALAIRRRVRA